MRTRDLVDEGRIDARLRQQGEIMMEAMRRINRLTLDVAQDLSRQDIIHALEDIADYLGRADPVYDPSVAWRDE